MNLAEIRKKAQREAQQETEPVGRQQAPRDFHEAAFDHLIEQEWGAQSAAPVQPQPHARQAQQQAPVEVQQAPVQMQQQAPVQAQQQAPVQAQQQAPVEVQQAPVEVQQQAPVQVQEQAPVQVQEQAPMQVQQQAPMLVQEQTYVPAQEQTYVPAQQEYYPSLPTAEVLEVPCDYDPLEQILKGRERAAAAADEEEDQEQDAATLELLCFKISTEEYAISIMDVKEIIKPREVTEVPRTPPFISGIISLRGIIIPVFDLRVRLGLPPQEASRKERIVVVKRQEGFCGVMVDQVVQVVRIGIGGIEPPPAVLEGIDRDFVHGIGRVDGRMLILLNMEKVLDVALS